MNPITEEITSGDKIDELMPNTKISLGFVPFLSNIEKIDEKYSIFFPYDSSLIKKSLKLKSDEELELAELMKAVSGIKNHQVFTDKDKIKSGDIIVKFDDRFNASSINAIGKISSQSKSSILFYPQLSGLFHDRIYLVSSKYSGKEGDFHQGALDSIKKLNGKINALKLQFFIKKGIFDKNGSNWYGYIITQAKEVQGVATQEVIDKF